MEKFVLKYFNLIRTIIAIAIGIIISIFVIYVISKNPGFSLKSFLLGPFLSKGRLGNLIETASPIIFCGLAISIPFQAEQFNIGAEGALFIGAAIGTAFAVSTSMPMIIHIPLVLLVAGLVGAFWGFIPGILKAKWNASELVASLMLNYVAYFLGLYIINYHFRDKAAGYLVSYQLPKTAWLSQFVPGTRIHWGIVIAFVFAILVYFFLYHTTLGYEIRMTGFNLHFSRYGGINVFKVIIISQVIGGFIAGIAGMTEVMGIHRRFNWQMSPGYGWDGVVVAIIGRNHPISIIFASLFLAYLRVGGQVLNLLSDIPSEVVTVIEAIIILLITAEAFLEQWRYRITIKEAERKEVEHEPAS
ncbi:MAG TPA: ABC transporter permease [Firmicutes bacterium]|nr:ABC transporter permease [Bacillota bacterium]